MIKIEDLDEWGAGAFTIKAYCDFSGRGRTAAYDDMDDGRLVWRQHGTRRLISKKSAVRLLAEGSESRAPHGRADERAA